MFTKLIGVNFQGHGRVEIDLDPRVTTIVGPTDAGKTSVLRLLRWIILNQPSGTGIITRGAKEAYGRLDVDGKGSIVRRRSKDLNTYSLNGNKFVSFGQNQVPEDIAKLLNVDEINFQRQLDPPFWFTESASQVSRNLNQILDLGTIDTAMSNVATTVRRARSTLDVSKERFESANARLVELDWSVDLEADFQALTAHENKATATQQKASSLESIITRLKSSAQTKEAAQKRWSDGQKVVALGEEAAKAVERADTLESLIEEISHCQDEIKRPVPDIGELLSLRQEADDLAEAYRKLEGLVVKLRAAKEKECLTRSNLSKSEKLLTEATKDRCPTCGQLVTKAKPNPLPYSSPTSTSRQDRR